MDLMFPHHECEIAQSTAACGHDSARYWMHNNMITINGQKMGKSLGNFITLEQFTTGRPSAARTGLLPDDDPISLSCRRNTAARWIFRTRRLQAAEKGYERLMKAVATTSEKDQAVGSVSTVDISDVERPLYGGDGRRPEFADGDFRTVRLRSDDQSDLRRSSRRFPPPIWPNSRRVV